ncbi:MAG: hypothetical protein WB608_12530 [Terracidiphilus sp.]
MSDIKNSVFHENSLSALAYITFAPAIYFLLVTRYKKSATVRFHAWQSLELNAALFIATYALALTMAFGPFVYVSLLAAAWVSATSLWLFCGMNALHGRRRLLPLLGPLAESLANRNHAADAQLAQ